MSLGIVCYRSLGLVPFFFFFFSFLFSFVRQHVNNSHLYQMLCSYNFFDKRNQNIISLSKFCQALFFVRLLLLLFVLFFVVFVVFFYSKMPMNRSDLRLSDTLEIKKNHTKHEKQMNEDKLLTEPR